ncbi:MAG: type II toxin-antitoxin system HicA family toxin [Armatimonadetes bacterium]|nr:type II toxin-antitoxin system HicA family toxin [Armatimonadota bacterium]
MGRKLRTLSANEVLSILTANGFVRVSQKGSHVKMRSELPESRITVIVPVHGRELPIGTLTAIIKQSGLLRELFEE